GSNRLWVVGSRGGACAVPVHAAHHRGPPSAVPEAGRYNRVGSYETRARAS
ncbi:hypothetical protein ACLOJK_015015, partial [Asimina triloba]